MEKFVEKFEKMTLAQALVIGLLLGGFYYLTSFDDGAGLEKEYSSNLAQLEKKRIVAAQTKRQLQNARRFEKEVNEVTQLFSRALEYLPTEVDIQGLRGKIIQQARIAGSSVVKVNPQSSRKKKGNYEEIFFEIELRGTFTSLARFLANITSLKVLINVRNIGLVVSTKTDKETILNLTGEFITYRYLGEK